VAAAIDRALGVALGAGRIVAVVGTPDSLSEPTFESMPLAGGTPEDAVEAIVALSEQLAGTTEAETPEGFAAVGAAVPGHVDHATGRVVYGYNLGPEGTSWEKVDFATMLAETFGPPAAIDNDVNCMVLYQKVFGLGRGEPSFVAIYLARDMAGLGSGILIDGNVVRGCSGGAGEFGHVVVQPGGARCPCGNRGCVEASVGVDTIVRNVNWGEHNNVTDLAGAALLAEEGDRRATDTFRQAGRSFGQGLSALVNLINPPLVILGGPREIVGMPTRADSARPSTSQRRRGRQPKQARQNGPRSADLFREGYEETLTAYSFAELETDCRIAVGSLTLEMAAVGAALLGCAALGPDSGAA
jgi:predicted NBD/HSP70 family sugar kinase